MELTDEQKAQVKQWVAEGSSLAEVQERLRTELGLGLTYMDVRFLVIDLGADVQDAPDTRAAVAPELDAAAAPDTLDGGPATDPPFGTEAPGPGEDPLSGAGGVSVQLDRIVRPGAVVSGSVTFSDGVAATWMLDQMGRLALDAGQPDYRPSQQDVQAFQVELRNALQSKGF